MQYSNFIREPFVGAWERNLEIHLNQFGFWALQLAIDIISSDISSLEPTGATSKNLARLIRNPNRYQTKTEFLKYYVSELLTSGNALIYYDKEADELHVIPFTQWQTMYFTDKGNDWVYVISTMSQSPIAHLNGLQLNPKQVIHAKYAYYSFTDEPLIGKPPILIAETMGTLGLLAQVKEGNLISGDKTKLFVFNIENDASEEQIEEFQKSLNGSMTNHIILPDGVKLTVLDKENNNNINQTNSQMYKDALAAVFAIFKIPAYKVGIDLGANVDSADEIKLLLRTYFQTCLNPIINGLAEGFRRLQGWQLDFNTILLNPPEKEFYDMLTPNEKRALMGLPAFDGDEYNQIYMQMQDLPINRVNENADKVVGGNNATSNA